MNGELPRDETGVGSACWGCSVEAEIGNERDPHPVPHRFHTCALLAGARRPKRAYPPTRFRLGPGPTGETGDHAREFLRALAIRGDDDFVSAEIHALVMLWLDDELTPKAEMEAISNILADLAGREKARKHNNGRPLAEPAAGTVKS